MSQINPEHSSPALPAMPAPTFLVTGTFAGAKPPAVNGVVVLSNNQVFSYTAPTAQPARSAALPSSLGAPAGLCGDLSNGVAVYSGSTVVYLFGVGISGASWKTLPPAPTSISAMCGDLANGLVVTDGASLYSLQINGAASEWILLAAPPAGRIAAIAGDPTNGVLLVINNDSGLSSLYFSAGGGLFNWVPLTAPSTNLPVSKVQVALACGSLAHGFILFGESRLLTVTVKYTAGSGTAPAIAAGVQTYNALPPFALSAMTGDATHGCTALGGASGLIANAGNRFAPWTVIGVVDAGRHFSSPLKTDI